LAEIAELPSPESQTSWARKALAAKNKLTAQDAKLLEDAFEKRLSAFPPSEGAEGQEIGTNDKPSAAQPGIDKSVLALSAPRRYRNRDHLRFVAQQPCLLCGRKPSDAHHIRFVQPRALGRKVSDEFSVPLCRSHHRAVHRAGAEEAWWKQAGIDPIKIARKLWKQTRMEEGRIEPDPPAQDAASDRPAESGGDAVGGQASV
jgi:hypothetical protein